MSGRAGGVGPGKAIHERAWPGAGRILCSAMLLAAAGVGATPAGTIVTPAIPEEVSYPGYYDYKNPSYQSFNRPPFGSPCRICPTDAIQGALNDCALLSALSAVAIASPGTIERAIVDTGRKDALGDEIYQISYWDVDHRRWQAVLITSSFPAQTESPTHTLWDNIYQRGYIANALTPFFIYAQLPAKDQAWWSRFILGANDATWALLMEKGFVAMPWISEGYKTPNLMNPDTGKGLFPINTLKQVTGFETTVHEVKSTPAQRVASVWIHDSPAVADVGGHSIILGLLRGNLKAVEPNLKTCVAPLGKEHISPICTVPCRESHACRASLAEVLDVESGQKVHVRVLDVDSRSGAEHEVYAFDAEPGRCTSDKPCTYDVPTSQWVLAGPLEVSFEMTPGDPLRSLDLLLARLTDLDAPGEKKPAAVIVGSRTKAQCPAGDSLCAQMFAPPTPLVDNHAYYLKEYVRSPTGPAGYNKLVIGDPHGGELAERTITLDEFYHSFLEIDENPTAHEKSGCTCQ